MSTIDDIDKMTAIDDILGKKTIVYIGAYANPTPERYRAAHQKRPPV
jgi:hypothetical protein